MGTFERQRLPSTPTDWPRSPPVSAKTEHQPGTEGRSTAKALPSQRNPASVEHQRSRHPLHCHYCTEFGFVGRFVWKHRCTGSCGERRRAILGRKPLWLSADRRSVQGQRKLSVLEQHAASRRHGISDYSRWEHGALRYSPRSPNPLERDSRHQKSH